jgi:TBC domain-containing protein kinase-like protein
LKQCTNITNITRLKKLTYQILSALVYLNENGIINRNLSLKNILFDNENNVKIDNWGFYEFTDKGNNVLFPIGNPEFFAPEIIKSGKCSLKVDTWSLGILLIYIYFGELPFNVDNQNYLEELFDSILSLKKIKKDNNIYLVGNDRCKKLELFFKDNKIDDQDLKIFKDFILTCLEPSYGLRPTPSDLLCHKFVKDINLKTDDWSHLTSRYYMDYNLFSEKIKDNLENDLNDNKFNIANPINNKDVIIKNDNDELVLENLQPRVIFYLWRLAGGDLEYEFIKQELISLPSIYRVRNASQIYYTLNDDNNSSGNNINKSNQSQQIFDPENLFQDKKIILYLDTLISKFDEYKQSSNNDFLISLLKNDSNFFISKNGVSQEKDISFNDFMNNNSDFVDFWSSSEINTLKSTKNKNRYNEISKIINENDKLNNNDKDEENKLKMEHLYGLSVLDKDVIFQYGRIKLFERLLNQYPSSWDEFIKEARLHIPSYLRGKIWAAALGIIGDSRILYNSLCEKNDLRCNDIHDNSNLELERQLDADIPRCHQYNDLLSSDIGRNKLKQVIKCWNIAESGNLVYWQGLDSVCAPFVALNFNEEEIAFSCLLKFIRKYMHGLFKLDNTFYIQSYLISMSHIIAFHDPELGSYLNKMGLTPNIYAIPWFMTMFTHVFPLDKIYMLWDKILTNSPSFPLFIGSAIVTQLHSELLSGDFDECVLLLSELSTINIDKCLEKAQLYLRLTPKSIIPKFLRNIKSDNNPMATIDIDDQNLDFLKDDIPKDIAIIEDLSTLHSDELAPRIDMDDFEKIYSKSLILDIRNESMLTTSEDNGYVVISPGDSYLHGHIKHSISIPYYENDLLPSSLIKYIKIIHEGYSYVVVVGEEEQATKLAAQLINDLFPRVAYLDVKNIKKEIFDSWNEDVWCTEKPEYEKFYIGDNNEDAKSLDIGRNTSPISTRSFNSEHPFENNQTFVIYKCY